MTRTSTLILIAAMQLGFSLPASTQGLPNLIVAVYNRAVSQSMLLEGEQTAAHVFQRAGIAIEWLDCTSNLPPAPCARPAEGNLFVLTIVKRWPVQVWNSDKLGMSVENQDGRGVYCYVFEETLESVVGETHVSRSRLLGYGIAHELGHLLMGAHSHSSVGIMSPRWSDSELLAIRLGSLSFTPEESALMREHLMEAEKSFGGGSAGSPESQWTERGHAAGSASDGNGRGMSLCGQ